MDNDIDARSGKIRAACGSQCRAMIRSIGEHVPAGVTPTTPEGGMSLWAGLPGMQS